MTFVQCLKFALPSEGLRMVAIALFLFSNHYPKGMKFSVLSKKMASTEFLRFYVPDSQ